MRDVRWRRFHPVAQPGHSHAIAASLQGASTARHHGRWRCVDGHALGMCAPEREDSGRTSREHGIVQHHVRYLAFANCGQRMCAPVGRAHLHPLVAQGGEDVPVERALPEVGQRRAGDVAQAIAHARLSVGRDVHIHGLPQVDARRIPSNLQGLVSAHVVDACHRQKVDLVHQKAPLRNWSELPSGRM